MKKIQMITTLFMTFIVNLFLTVPTIVDLSIYLEGINESLEVKN